MLPKNAPYKPTVAWISKFASSPSLEELAQAKNVSTLS